MMRLATDKESKNFFKRLIGHAHKNRRPFNVMFELTYKCNFHCPHCYIPRSHKTKRELSINKIYDILDQLKEAGVYSIGFTGGEPLVRKDIFDIFSHANKNGFKYSLLSNGYFIDKDTARKLKQVNIDKVEITLNSLKPSVFNNLTGTKGAFARVKNAAKVLTEEDIQVIMKSTCMKANRDEIVEISEFAGSLKIPYKIDSEILPCRSGSKKWPDILSLSIQEINDIKRKIYPEMFMGKGRERTRLFYKRESMFNCSAGMTSFSISPYGEMNFCLEINYPRYNILSRGIRTCWEELKQNMDSLNRVEYFICRDCDLRNYCGWCPGRSFIETGRFDSCSEYSRKRALEARETVNKGGPLYEQQ